MGLYTIFNVNFYKRKRFCFLTPGCVFLDLFETFCLFRFRMCTCWEFLRTYVVLFRGVSCVDSLRCYVTCQCDVIVWCGPCVWSVSCCVRSYSSVSVLCAGLRCVVSLRLVSLLFAWSRADSRWTVLFVLRGSVVLICAVDVYGRVWLIRFAWQCVSLRLVSWSADSSRYVTLRLDRTFVMFSCRVFVMFSCRVLCITLHVYVAHSSWSV
jgi:hypothetical protein